MGIVEGFCNVCQAHTEGLSFASPQGLKGGASESTGMKRKRQDSDLPDYAYKSDRLLPVVRFPCGRVLCGPTAFECVSANGKLEATRNQVSRFRDRICHLPAAAVEFCRSL